ncbi:MAG: ZIP family metal transporter [Halieaceae bacterium]|jgi:zinc and cadmium transporter|nr:ZIP family metal transporter [Halieaceae bacterium]
MMSVLGWIIASGLLMSAIALVGSISLLLSAKTLDRLLLPMVAFAAGSLLGGAFFHMLPVAYSANPDPVSIGVAVAGGFTVFFVLEQFLHWHHCHLASSECRQPMGYLLLVGDGLHNFLGGLAIAGIFLTDIRAGIAAWIAAALHEVPQELGDFGVLVRSGWSKPRALIFNVLSGLTFLLGGLVAYGASFQSNLSWLIPFAAGNFIYIAAADLVPEVHKHGTSDIGANLIHLASFALGLGFLLVVAP